MLVIFSNIMVCTECSKNYSEMKKEGEKIIIERMIVCHVVFYEDCPGKK